VPFFPEKILIEGKTHPFHCYVHVYAVTYRLNAVEAHAPNKLHATSGGHTADQQAESNVAMNRKYYKFRTWVYGESKHLT
jgi:hypothetical protein